MFVSGDPLPRPDRAWTGRLGSTMETRAQRVRHRLRRKNQPGGEQLKKKTARTQPTVNEIDPGSLGEEPLLGFPGSRAESVLLLVRCWSRLLPVVVCDGTSTLVVKVVLDQVVVLS